MNTEQRQLAKKRQLLALKDILDEMGIKFWLHGGVLLGYYRNRDLMDYDPDLDIGMLKSDIPDDFVCKLDKRLSTANMRIYWVSDSRMKICMDTETWEQEPQCDIWMLSGDGPGRFLASAPGKNGDIVYEYDIPGFVEAKFLGTTFLVPANPKELLLKQYGPSWETPKKKFNFSKDPYNIVGKPTLVLDDTPAGDVIKNRKHGKLTAVFGPLTIRDADILSKNCEKAVVFSEQPEMKINNVKFVRCDETHGAVLSKELKNSTFDCVVVPHPEIYNKHNMRTMLETVWNCLKDGGKLVFAGDVPDCLPEFMFERENDDTFLKYELHENWEKNITAVVTTFESKGILEKCIESIKKHHKDMRIIVVDNSKTISHIDGVRTIALPFDSGLSASRNAGILHVQTPYTLITDDDQILLEPNSVKKLYDSLVSNKLDIVGGESISSVYKTSMKYFGKIIQTPGKIVVTNEITKILEDGTEIVDLTLNFFVSKTETLKKLKWRSELKVCEHLDFFIRAKKAGLKVGNLKGASCWHEKGAGTRTKQYQNYRDRAASFRKKWMRLTGIQFYEGPWGDKYTATIKQPTNPQTQSSRPKPLKRESQKVWMALHKKK